nr:AMP-binding protein [Planctomycetota bacterium]
MILATETPSACAETSGSAPIWFVLDSLSPDLAAAAHLVQSAESAHTGLWPRSNHLGRVFEAVALARPGHASITSDQGGVTYRALRDAAHAVRDELLATRGFLAGDRVVLLLENGPEYAAALYGTLLACGVVVPLPPNAESSRVEHAIQATDARCVLSSAKVVRRRRQQLAAEPAVLKLAATTDQVVRNETALPIDDSLAAIFFTSGSSGEPKGVTLSHANLLSNAASIIEYLGITSNERALGLLPFYHAFGNSVLQTHLLTGATIVLAESSIFPETILDAVRDHNVTSLSGVPDLFRTLLSRTSFGEVNLPSLRYLAVAGGRLDPDQAQTLAFRAAPAKLIIMYGQTEATARLSYLPAEEFEDRY